MVTGMPDRMARSSAYATMPCSMTTVPAGQPDRQCLIINSAPPERAHKRILCALTARSREQFLRANIRQLPEAGGSSSPYVISPRLEQRAHCRRYGAVIVSRRD
jgi:hypothetical protein